WPVALLDADDAAHDLDDALRQQDRAGERNDRLEGIDRRPLVGDVRVLVDLPGLPGVEEPGPGKREYAGQEEDDEQDQVDGRLRARAEETVQDVAAHVPVLRQRIRA